MSALQTASGQNNKISDDVLEKVLVSGDLSALTQKERLVYINKVCETLGLNPLTRPFEYTKFQNSLKLYVRKDATEQLRKINKISITGVSAEILHNMYIVTVHGSTPDGRTDSEIGVVNILGLKGDALANAMMKGNTKAKRRLTLSMCGLGFLDESELDTIPNMKKVTEEELQKEEETIEESFSKYIKLIDGSKDINELQENYKNAKLNINKVKYPELIEKIVKEKDKKKEELTKELANEYLGKEEEDSESISSKD